MRQWNQTVWQRIQVFLLAKNRASSGVAQSESFNSKPDEFLPSSLSTVVCCYCSDSSRFEPRILRLSLKYFKQGMICTSFIKGLKLDWKGYAHQRQLVILRFKLLSLWLLCEANSSKWTLNALHCQQACLSNIQICKICNMYWFSTNI